ncbi:type II CAAX endopeptidase family protein [Paenibacillus sp. LHD-117]|uniref:CPBP family intramembrane glutamic endopeptidase n=1 Tax=Paenibacillus sp. LHD-117 TaxID=3071412 RepID=UPI0027DF9EE5|nr:type II CAAX endopeptidase family protein [Paenibacillus sp. LHD-117]MDQ6423466.1 type II CAAX endopeptidase family protein [Paenibacillus sp. LHD-117]
MDMKREKREVLAIVHIGIYYVVFYAAWLFVRTYLNVDSQTVFWGLYNVFTKIVIWVLPVILYIKIVEKDEWVTFLKLNKKIEKWHWLVIPLVLLVIYLVLVNSVIFNQPFFNIKSGVSEWLKAVIFAGIIEEILFRGFFLNKLASRMKFWKANLVTTIMFILIHYPLWLSLHHSALDIFINSVYIGIISFTTGYIWKKTNSLWGPVLFHTSNNMIVTIIGL